MPGFEDLDPFTDRGQRGLWLFHETSHDGGNQPRLWLNCGNDEHVHGVNLGIVLPRALRPDLPMATRSEMRVQLDDGPSRPQAVATREESPDRWTTFDLPPAERPAEGFPRLLAEGRSMTVRWFDLPPLRFDLAGGGPAIADFAAKCEAMLREPRIVDED